MYRIMKKSKIHRATVTEANLNYVGSITIDSVLMDQAGLLENEKVMIVDVDNGARFETYIIEGESNTGVICLNGAAARMVHKGDKVIIISFALYDEKELASFKTKSVFVDGNNRVVNVE
ncbi:MAG TPA: aspartate 1-decarboxylase [Ruminiclostridium sp.]|nr:aspartate 1-decarboxylase [Ruminiclostridium sp.]